jgi:hypothetical protein
MSDWFGETPVEIREFSPSHFSAWVTFCEGLFCDKESVVKNPDGLFLCLDCANEDFNDRLERK